MQRKVGRVSDELNQVISSWDGIEAVVLGESAEAGILDPYFTISLDVYHEAGLPPSAERKQLFGDPTAFETVPGYTENRFLLEELPVKNLGRRSDGLDLNECRGPILHQGVEPLQQSGLSYPAGTDEENRSFLRSQPMETIGFDLGTLDESRHL